MHLARAPDVLAYFTDGNPDGDFLHVANADAEAQLSLFPREVQAARGAAVGRQLDEAVISAGHNQGRQLDVRWLYAHMIEEYARHNGHAALVQERIDGAAGD